MEKTKFMSWFGGVFDMKGTVCLRIRPNGQIQPMIQIRGKKPVLQMIRKELGLHKKVQFHRYTKSHMDRIPHCKDGDWTIDLISKDDITDFAHQMYFHSLLKTKQLALITKSFGTKDLEELREIQMEMRR